jgi:alkanesulfonate monooxygenase SsuD/methylene tetrahydromethanopterin reductase-like flavin-dependent oxidoreductase (luciferase family)
MIAVGWFGVGSGVLADAEGVAEIATAAEDLGFESIWVGEHPVLIDPHAAPPQ